MKNNLDDFYEKWSSTDPDKLLLDNSSATRKFLTLINSLPILNSLEIKNILDYGCGYGKLLFEYVEKFNLINSYGFDYSLNAINYASKEFSNESITYKKLHSLDNYENVEYIKSVANTHFDAVLLIDLLEHVPKCQDLIIRLSTFVKYFIIILPLEKNIVDNYILKKEYPSTIHSNGHLREFDVNSVFYFIRKLGFTPVQESYRVYDFRDSFPPTKYFSLKRLISKYTRMCFYLILPTKLYLKIIGYGTYCCVATFNEDHILDA